MHLHIYSQTGKKMTQFLGARSNTEKKEKMTVLFGSGCEFMVCDRSKDQMTGVVHIYVREICLGLSNPVIWLDDQKNAASYQNSHRYI